MTREEAIKILEDGEWWDSLDEFYETVNPEFQKLHDAVDMALSALRAQAEAEKNEPLTLDELREMDGEPVWVEVPDGYKHYNGWALVDVTWKKNNVIYLVRAHGPVNPCEAVLKNGWKIYRRKPEEGIA